MGWVTVKKKARRGEGTAGTQAGGWLLFYCCGGSVLLYVRVNVKRGEGKQGNGVLAGCWQLPRSSSSGRHRAHTVTASYLPCLPCCSRTGQAAPPSPKQTSPRYKLGYLVTEGHSRQFGVMELG